ncbi:MAG: PHP domain-containing protein [Candidatus Aminicenantes bacterium]|nr:MAG: PHP domain-containing protein [Candidatus Aminicenantes bacterium]
MRWKVDLHIHSNKSSDGDFSPFHIIQLSKKNKLRAISIADHDTVAAYPEALELGEDEGIEVIPSLELTTLFDDREFHLLLPFVDWRKKIVSDLIDKVAKGRIVEGKERIRKLQEIGFDINWKEVSRKSKPNPPLGVTIAQVLLEKYEKKNHPSLKKYYEEKNRMFAPYFFYRDYFTREKPAWVPKRNLDLLEALRLAPEIGAVPVLAHPGAYFQRASKYDLAILKSSGLEGLEVYTFYHDDSQVEQYKILAEELDLVPTAGSDFHGKIKPHISFGSLKEGEYWMVEELRKRKR